MFENADVIFSYTRKQALEDGVLVDLTKISPSDTRVYKCQVACTTAVWSEIKKAEKMGQELGASIWDVCYMSVKFVVKKIDEATALFKVGIPLGGRELILKRMVHGGDNGEMVVTIMFPDED